MRIHPGAVVFLVALAARLLHLWQIRAAPFATVLLGDAKAYDAWAQRIAAGDWLGSEVFYQAPLYPYFVALIYAIAGRDLIVLRIAQAIVGAGSCVFLGLAARRLFSPAAGWIAGIGLALYAPAIFFDALVQKTVLDVFFMCLALWLIAGLIAEPGRRAGWAALGLTIGALSLTRENALIFAAVIIGWALVRPLPQVDRIAPQRRRKAVVAVAPRRWRAQAGNAAAFVVAVTLVLLPVALRNYAVDGGFYLTTSQFGPNFYIGNNPNATGAYAPLRFGRGAPEYERQDAVALAQHAVGRMLTPAEVSAYWSGRALDFITTQPLAWLRLTARKLLLLVNSVEMLDTESQDTHAEWSILLRVGGAFGHFGVLVPLFCVGLWATWHDRQRLWIFHALAGTYAASVLMFYVFARYRFPLVPLLLLFAAAGIVRLRHLREVMPARRAAAAAGLAAVVAVTNWPLLQRSMMMATTETNLGAELYDLGRYDEAIHRYERAIEFNATYVPAYNNRGVALAAKGQLDRAVEDYQHAIALHSDFPDAHYNLGNALLARNDPSGAAAHFRIALEMIPGTADVHNNLGLALMADKRSREAMDQFRAALKADPRSAIAHRNLADVLAAEGRIAEGITHMLRAVELRPADAALRYDLGSMLLESGRPAEAEPHFRESIRGNPRSAEAHNNLGIALGSQGRLSEAVDHFRQALVINPGFADARRNLEIAGQAQGAAPGRQTLP